jgi:hypothetical protein
MYKYAIIIQYTSLLPIIIAALLHKYNTLFLKRHIMLSYLSIVSEVVGLFCAYYFRNNLVVYAFYIYISISYLYWIWSQYTVFKYLYRKLINGTTIGILTAITTMYIFYDSKIAFTAGTILSLSYMLFLGLLYYYTKTKEEHLDISLKEPIFIVGSAYILYGLSVIMIYTSYYFIEKSDSYMLIFTRGFFYFIYNVILAYAYYMNYKQKVK